MSIEMPAGGVCVGVAWAAIHDIVNEADLEYSPETDEIHFFCPISKVDAYTVRALEEGLGRKLRIFLSSDNMLEDASIVLYRGGKQIGDAATWRIP